MEMTHAAAAADKAADAHQLGALPSCCADLHTNRVECLKAVITLF